MPDAHLQQPWTWDGSGAVLGRAYPQPIVEPVAAAKAAKDAVYARRRAHRGDAETEAIVQKHASRKRPPRKPRSAKPKDKAAKDAQQLRFDL